MSARTRLPMGLVTFLFTDIEGSTRLAQVLGAHYRAMLAEHRGVLRTALGATDGAELFSEGDSLFWAFPDASAALVACARAQRDLAGHDWRMAHVPRIRMGLHTGLARPYGGEYATPVVHRAARITAAAHGGQVLCSAATADSAGTIARGVVGDATRPGAPTLLDLGLHRLRGFDGRERLFQLCAPGLVRRFPRLRDTAGAAHNLPIPLTTLVGREGELRELTPLLERQRLVTVVGPGGVGKTRLAVELATRLVPGYPDGVWFADLATVADAELLTACVADALGVRPEPGRPLVDTVAEHTATRRMLLVLDTCDSHPAAAARFVARVLAAGPDSAVLATGREPLGLPGEPVWRIAPLAVRPAGPGRPSDALALLLDRAATARGGRPVGVDEAADLARVAASMDGLPLALELAAARLRVMSAAQLAARAPDVLLDPGRPGVPPHPLPAPAGAGTAPVRLAADRHRTMDATVDWSYRTLRDDAAAVLRRLSVFAGPVDLATVESVLGADPVPEITTLVEKSLVQAEYGADGTRYRVLGAIRPYAARRLRDSGEEPVVRDRHVAWCRVAAQRAGRGPDGHPVTLSLYTLDPLADELRAALRWTVVGGRARSGLALVGAFDRWWPERGLAAEARSWLTRLYERMAATAEQMPDGELAAADHSRALLAGADGDHAEALTCLRRAEEAALRAGDPGLLARIRAARGASLLAAGQPREAERACREAIAWAAGEGVQRDSLGAVCCLARLLWRRGALDEAAGLLAAARPLEAARPAERGRRTVDMILGLVALSRGDLVAAHDHLVVALRSRIGHGFTVGAGETLSAIAVRCARGGEPLLAATLFGAAQAGRARLRVSAGAARPYWRAEQAAVRASLGDTVFDAAYARGGTLDLGAAAALALAVDHPDLALDSHRFAV